MKRMEKLKLKDALTSLLILSAALGAALMADHFLVVGPLIPMFFILASFWISQLTDSHLWGILASFCSVLAINYVFTEPYLAFDFEVMENVVFALIFLVVSVSTGTLTQNLKRHEQVKAELDRETVRANLLRAVSHDLRTPLTSIYGASNTILENYSLLSDEDKKQMLAGMQEDSQWLIRMVENLLSITKIGSSEVSLNRSSVVVEELIGAALDKFQRRYPEQHVEVELPDSLIIVSIDAILIQQVLVNLLENAVHHAEGMKHLKLKVSEAEGKVTFEVTDNGCGVPEDQLPRLFSGTLKSGGDGNHRHNMGIGLSVCATIIKAHQGKIYARPAFPRGLHVGFLLEAEEVIHE